MLVDRQLYLQSILIAKSITGSTYWLRLNAKQVLGQTFITVPILHSPGFLLLHHNVEHCFCPQEKRQTESKKKEKMKSARRPRNRSPRGCIEMVCEPAGGTIFSPPASSLVVSLQAYRCPLYPPGVWRGQD